MVWTERSRDEHNRHSVSSRGHIEHDQVIADVGVRVRLLVVDEKVLPVGSEHDEQLSSPVFSEVKDPESADGLQ